MDCQSQLVASGELLALAVDTVVSCSRSLASPTAGCDPVAVLEAAAWWVTLSETVFALPAATAVAPWTSLLSRAASEDGLSPLAAFVAALTALIDSSVVSDSEAQAAVVVVVRGAAFRLVACDDLVGYCVTTLGAELGGGHTVTVDEWADEDAVSADAWDIAAVTAVGDIASFWLCVFETATEEAPASLSLDSSTGGVLPGEFACRALVVGEGPRGSLLMCMCAALSRLLALMPFEQADIIGVRLRDCAVTDSLETWVDCLERGASTLRNVSSSVLCASAHAVLRCIAAMLRCTQRLSAAGAGLSANDVMLLVRGWIDSVFSAPTRKIASGGDSVL